MVEVRSVHELLSRYRAGGRNFQGSDLRQAGKANRVLPGINLSFANFSGCDLSSTRRPKADLHRANLSFTMAGSRICGRGICPRRISIEPIYGGRIYGEPG